MNELVLEQLEEGMKLVYGGNRYITVDASLADQFQSGDSIVIVEQTGTPLIIPAKEKERVATAVDEARAAFYELGRASHSDIDTFYRLFASFLADDAVWKKIQEVNSEDVKDAKTRGRSTTRLIADEKCRQNMIDGLHDQLHAESTRGKSLGNVSHEGWEVELIQSEMGVVGFVFEGRPNVIADATGVLKSGNTVVFRVGQDALQTAHAIMNLALYPALEQSGLPKHCVNLIDSKAHSAGWALFSNKQMALVIARGSGAAVRTLGGLANQHGIPVSLHGTGGAWMLIDQTISEDALKGAIVGSLDRKVCNTLNTIVIERAACERLIPEIIEALTLAGDRLNHPYRIHVDRASQSVIPSSLFEERVSITRASGKDYEPVATLIDREALGHEWEWETAPEVSIVVVDTLQEGAELFNTYSPQFVLSVLSDDRRVVDDLFGQVNAPFYGNGMTRWVDGQYALNAPELGLSNWENGRFLARSGLLSGSQVFTVRLKMNQTDRQLSR